MPSCLARSLKRCANVSMETFRSSYTLISPTTIRSDIRTECSQCFIACVMANALDTCAACAVWAVCLSRIWGTLLWCVGSGYWNRWPNSNMATHVERQARRFTTASTSVAIRLPRRLTPADKQLAYARLLTVAPASCSTAQPPQRQERTNYIVEPVDGGAMVRWRHLHGCVCAVQPHVDDRPSVPKHIQSLAGSLWHLCKLSFADLCVCLCATFAVSMQKIGMFRAESKIGVLGEKGGIL